MSIIQVMDSTKTGRAIYVVASGLIVVGVIAAILQTMGQELVLSIESSTYLVPLIGLFSLLLWIRKPDRSVVEHYTIKYIYKRERVSEICVQMASVLLYVAPWECSPLSAFSIEISLRNELDRTMRSSELKEQIDNYKQAFWLVLLTPFSFILIVALYQIEWWMMGIVGIVVGFVLAFLLLRENNKTLARIIDYSFARWSFELTSLDLNRRKASIRMPSQHQDRLEASLELVKPVIDLATKGDWRGFDKNSGNLEHIVGIPGYDRLTWNLVKRYLTFLDWCVKHIYTQHTFHVDLFLKNGRKQVISAITALRAYREDSFNEEEELVAKMLHVLTSYAEDKETFRSFSVEFYEKLDKLSLMELSDGHLEILGMIPLNLKQPAQWVQTKIPEASSDIKGIDRLSWFVTSCAELGLLNLPRSLSVIARWGTEPTTVLKATGPLSTKTLLENDVGFSVKQLTTIARALGRRILNDDRTDPYKILKHLEELKKNNPRQLVKKYALELQVDTIRSSTEELNNGMEAITRFIDDFDKT